MKVREENKSFDNLFYNLDHFGFWVMPKSQAERVLSDLTNGKASVSFGI